MAGHDNQPRIGSDGATDCLGGSRLSDPLGELAVGREFGESHPEQLAINMRAKCGDAEEIERDRKFTSSAVKVLPQLRRALD